MNYRTLLTPIFFAALQATAQTPASPSPPSPVLTQPPVSISAIQTVSIRLREPAGNNGEVGRHSDNASPHSVASAGFSHFEVIDERADTGRIGIHTCVPDFGRNYDRQLVLEDPTGHSAAGEISTWLNSRFAHAGSSYTALVILRTLWLSDANYARAEYLRHPERRLERTHIRLKAEIYSLRDGRYYPVLRFDTLQTAMKRRIIQQRSPYVEWGRDLAAILDALADSASRVTPGNEEDNRWVALADIREFNASRFHAPINDNRPAPGVYANFEEFRNNTPSIQNFEIKVENNERVLYIRESGATYYKHDAWGYSDGKDIFIMRDGVLCPAWKEGKAFYLPTAQRNSYFAQRSIFFVDMDSGELY